MAVDRIGNKGSVVPVDGAGASSPVAATGDAPFEVTRAGAPPATDLERVRSGELPVAAWIDGRVAAATAHLAGKLAPEQLAFVQDALRRQLATDPLLADLAKAATGVAPPVEE